MPIQLRPLCRGGFRGVAAGLLALPVLAPATIVGGLAPAAALGAPEPQPIPRRWQLDLEVGPLRLMQVQAPGHPPREYLFLTYKVVNNSGEDLLFAPSFELATEEGHVLRSGRDVPAAVTQHLLNELENPFLEDQISIIGMLLQGEENAKEGLVVWPADGLNVDEIAIYAAGFSGETVTLELPAIGRGATATSATIRPRPGDVPPPQPATEPAPAPAAPAPAESGAMPAPDAPDAPRLHGAPAMEEAASPAAASPGATGASAEPTTTKVVLRKTLMLRYRIPGELSGRGLRPIPVEERRWIMR